MMKWIGLATGLSNHHLICHETKSRKGKDGVTNELWNDISQNLRVFLLERAHLF